MKFNSLKIAGSLFVMALTVISCGGKSGGQQAPGQQVQSYPVLQLQPQSVTLTTSYPAKLKGFQTVEIRPRVEGNITKMLIDEGAQVHKGETLFRLSDAPYQQQVRSAEADIEAAKAGVATAKSEVERLKPLVQKDIISKYRLKKAQNDLQSQEAARAQAHSALQNAKVNLGYTYIKSPANGVIGNIPYRVGSLVSSNITKPLTTVSDISEVYAYFSLSERQLLGMTRSTTDEVGPQNLRQQVKAIPKVNLLLSDGTVYDHQGTVNLASGLIEQGTGSASFRALFPNPNQVLRSGGSGSVQIPVHIDSVILVPKKSTYEIQNKTFVYILSDSNTVESTPVETRPLSTKQLYVVDKGLSKNDRIVVSGMGNLQDAAKIKPHPVDADSLFRSLKKQDQSQGSSQRSGNNQP